MYNIDNNALSKENIIRGKIEKLRPKLLDLSTRNPLIFTRLSARSISYIRVIDELPEAICDKLRNHGEMRFVALPPLDSDPKDERDENFRKSLSAARIQDEQYLADLANVDDDIPQELIERNLKDRVRASLGMPPRQQKDGLSLEQHAKNNNIRPSFELPLPHETQSDGRYIDNNIQTLLLPDDLIRKLNGLLRKCNSWEQETGINALHVAFGFLERTDSDSAKRFFAPLLLLSVRLQKRKTKAGPEFRVIADSDNAETNFVLAIKLQNDFGINLPTFTDEETIEKYFTKISQIISDYSAIRFRLRRQIVVGVFPSATISMYNDLEFEKHQFSDNEVISNLLYGTEDNISISSVGEYNVDAPEIEEKVKCLVMDADSSQFTTIVEVANGKNLAVEGPPGSGKSQTIVNVIASALAEGKKVLFVAEKMAALEVVKSRLEAIGLGEFLLPLQPNRSTREQVINSIRIRDSLNVNSFPILGDYQGKISHFRNIRDDITSYLKITSSIFGKTDLKVYQILWKNIRNEVIITSLPEELLSHKIDDIETYDNLKLSKLIGVATTLEKTWQKASVAKKHWSGIGVGRSDGFFTGQLTRKALDTSQSFLKLAKAVEHLHQLQILVPIDIHKLNTLLNFLSSIEEYIPQIKANVVATALKASPANYLAHFFDNCKLIQQNNRSLSEYIDLNKSKGIPENLRRLKYLCDLVNITQIAKDCIDNELRSRTISLRMQHKILQNIGEFTKIFPPARFTQIRALRNAYQLVNSASQELLSIRNEFTSIPAKIFTLKTICRDGKALKIQSQELASILSSTTNIDESVVASHISILETSGFFAFLSSRYRIAKRFYLARSKTQSFDKKQAIADLHILADFLHKENQLKSNPHVQELFGAYFKGIDTDFDLFAKLAEYYEGTESLLSGAQNSDLRNLLKYGDASILRSLPDIPDFDFSGTTEDLNKTFSDEVNKLANFKDISAELKELVKLFKTPISTDVLPDLATKVESLESSKDALDNDTLAKDILNTDFNGWATLPDKFKNEIKILELLSNSQNNIGQVLLPAFESGTIGQVRNIIQLILSYHNKSFELLNSLKESAKIDFKFTCDANDFAGIASFLQQASQDTVGITAHTELASQYSEFALLGFTWIANSLFKNKGSLIGLADITEAIVFRYMAVCIYDNYGNTLSRYHRTKLEELRKQLAALDKEIILMSREYLKNVVARSANPPIGIGYGLKSQFTEYSLINSETSKSRAYIPVRELTRRAGKALQELKPCWMMSPLAIAHYLPQNSLQFDLCILDEASQMPPENAIGALVRCNQAMIVGDTNQLPPSNFFKSLLGDSDDDEDLGVPDESILDLANKAFHPKRRLRWHYRSRDSSLIQFSNHYVYEDNLIIFPSPFITRPDMGVSLVPVSGQYKSGINQIEASTIVDSVLNFMKTSPDRSLGVVTLNQQQSELIQEEMDRKAPLYQHAVRYLERWQTQNDGLESFFIKNLENVQGDERDVIYIGTVYGPETIGGTVMQRFGPINGKAGKRRLNVLFTRAKKQIVTFSSMSADDIKAEKDKNEGAYMLKCWIVYSSTGRLLEPITSQAGIGQINSDFEMYIIDQLKLMGCEGVPKIGVGGYCIDIGVKHKNWPNGYILGIECDGETYHAANSARERDRLRDEVLTNLGWTLYRIWSTSWFTDLTSEIKRLQNTINARLALLLHSSDRNKTKLRTALRSNNKTSGITQIDSPNPPQATEDANQFLQNEATEQQDDKPKPISTTTDSTPENKTLTQSGPNIVEKGDTVHVNGYVNWQSYTNIVKGGEGAIGNNILGAQLGDQMQFDFSGKTFLLRIEKIIKSNATDSLRF
jgi:hypothetical protein